MKVLMLVALLVLTSAVSWANPTLTTTNLITELLMNDEVTNASLMALFLGPDFSSQVTYTTFVDRANLSFSFSSQTGSMYLGQSLNLSGSGVFDPNTGIMSLASSGALGLTQWSTSGQFFVTGDSNGYQFTGQESLFSGGFSHLPPSPCLTWKFVDAELNDDGTSLAMGTWMNVCTRRQGVWDSEDIYADVGAGRIELETTVFGVPETYRVHERGTSPPDGGPGENVITYSSTAEPSSILLLGIGVLGVAKVVANHRCD
jgi:hypothetical protein